MAQGVQSLRARQTNEQAAVRFKMRLNRISRLAVANGVRLNGEYALRHSGFLGIDVKRDDVARVSSGQFQCSAWRYCPYPHIPLKVSRVGSGDGGVSASNRFRYIQSKSISNSNSVSGSKSRSTKTISRSNSYCTSTGGRSISVSSGCYIKSNTSSSPSYCRDCSFYL